MPRIGFPPLAAGNKRFSLGRPPASGAACEFRALDVWAHLTPGSEDGQLFCSTRGLQGLGGQPDVLRFPPRRTHRPPTAVCLPHQRFLAAAHRRCPSWGWAGCPRAPGRPPWLGRGGDAHPVTWSPLLPVTYRRRRSLRRRLSPAHPSVGGPPALRLWGVCPSDHVFI